MEVHNISIDDNEADTSGDEVEDEEYESVFRPFEQLVEEAPVYVTDQGFRNEIKDWRRQEVALDTVFFSSSVLQEQPEHFQFFLLDTVSTVTGVKHPGIELDKSVQDARLHNVVRLFGVTIPSKEEEPEVDDGDGCVKVQETEKHESKDSVSVCCNIHGFLPYFYILPVPTSFDDVDEEGYWKSRNKDDFERYLNEGIRERILKDITSVQYHEFLEKGGRPLAKIDLVTAAECGGIYHFFERNGGRSKGTMLLKVYCSLPRFIWTAHSFINGRRYRNIWKMECFESNLNNTVRFLADRNMTGSSWYELKGSKYFVRNDKENPLKESHCQIEIDVHFKDFIKLDDTHPRYRFEPSFRILSFDIEVMVSADDNTSPRDGRKQVLQIGAVLGNYCTAADAKQSIIGKTVFVLGTCQGISDAKVFQFYIKENPQASNEQYLEDAEAKLLCAFRDFVVLTDPDIILGYNIKKFDIPYLMDRSAVLATKGLSASVLPFLGRLCKMKAQHRNIENDMKRVHQHDEQNTSIQGRIMFDLYPILVRHDRRQGSRGYFKLGNVAKRFLGKKEEKQDVHYSEIESLQHGGPIARNRMAQYCLQDAMIPYLILFEPVPCRNETIRFLDLYLRKSRQGGPPLRYLLNKSICYNEYFKQVRLQKNPGLAIYIADTPSPRKRYKTDQENGNPAKMYFTIDEEPSSSNGTETIITRATSKFDVLMEDKNISLNYPKEGLE